MIDPKELRIGNWIMDIEPYNYCFQISGSHICKAEVGWEYRPIELTPAVLEKCGFNKGDVQSGGFYGYNNRILQLDNDFGLTLFDGRIDESVTREFYPQIKSLHQLQNLYFFLTGEELEYKYHLNAQIKL